MKKNIGIKIFGILLITLVLAFYDLPASTQKQILPFTPESILEDEINLGLDLQGGSQLDYKIDLREVPAEDKESIIEGVQTVIERRVNSLGVAEPSIYTSEVAEETHIIVELSETTALTDEDVEEYYEAGITIAELNEDQLKMISLEKAKATVGKTIQLEFKEEKTTPDEEETEKVKEKAQISLDKVVEGDDFSILGQEEQQANPGKVTYDTSDYKFEDELLPFLKNILPTMEEDTIHEELLEVGGSFTIGSSGNAIENKGWGIVKLIDTKEEVKNEKEVDVSHILISWEGLESANATVNRTKEEALDLAKEIKEKLNSAGDLEVLFSELAKEHSDDASNKEDGGILNTPVIGDGNYVFDFEEASLAFNDADEISDIVETQFGYHIIKADQVRLDVGQKKYKYDLISYSTITDEWEDTELDGEHFVHADLQLDQINQPYVSIRFNDEGADIFEELTEKNVGKRLAIFVGGELISAPRVNEVIAGGTAQINGQFSIEEAKTLARDLNTGAIPAPIILTGEYTIGASLGHEALNKSLKAGAIGLLLVMVFMILFYRLAGLIASIALTVYGSILIFLIKSQLHLGIALLFSLIVFAFIVYKVSTNKDSGAEKFVSFILACAAFLFITYLLRTGVVLTLAGTAGLILSIGMAVDANILIFERFKEELRKGKTYQTALQNGFTRAWTSIRDSNFSTLITCAILFYFGSSIIKGFAFNLAAGILVSMFTAITVTKTLLQGFIGKKIAKNISLFGAGKTEEEGYKAPQFRFIKRTGVWLTISGILVTTAIVSFFVIGLNLGIDFTGGTLMEFRFEEQIDKNELEMNIQEAGAELAEEQGKVVGTTSEGSIFNIALAETMEETATSDEDLAEEVSNSELESDEIVNEEESVEVEAEEDNETNSIMLENKDLEEGEEVIKASEEKEQEKIDLRSIAVIPSGDNTFIVKTKYLTSATHDLLIDKLEDRLPVFNELRFTTIGPVIGKTLLMDAIKAIILAIVMIILYVAFAFRRVSKSVSKWKFGACAIIALLHDVIIVSGLFVILGYLLNVEIDALFITAMLTVLGYSVNDTIVVFDRLKENLAEARSDERIDQTADIALNQTLYRSINTSVSTLIALCAILFMGSFSIFYFILALTVGTAIGTYSSIFLATPILTKWKQAEKE
ncbi:protein translocase subunit SecF [Patescibacteria group bacterium]